MNKIMIQVFFSIILTSLMGTVSNAKPISCKKDQGLWLKTTGETICKKCPNESEIVSGKALKMPFGCKSPISGALLEIELYKYLRSQDEYAKELELFKNKLEPAINGLKAQIEQSLSLSKIANEKREEMFLLAEKLNVQNEKLKTSNTFLKYGVISLGVTTILVTYAHFQFGH